MNDTLRLAIEVSPKFNSDPTELPVINQLVQPFIMEINNPNFLDKKQAFRTLGDIGRVLYVGGAVGGFIVPKK